MLNFFRQATLKHQNFNIRIDILVKKGYNIIKEKVKEISHESYIITRRKRHWQKG